MVGQEIWGQVFQRQIIVLYITQDAMPADEHLIEEFIKVFEAHSDIGVAYGRQLPKNDCNIIERFTRRFNYPEKSRIKSKYDLNELGIKTFFVRMFVLPIEETTC